MKLRQILIGIFIITSFSCYDALEEVYKEANLSPASLASLDIFPGSMSPGFDSDTTSYSVSVENGYSSVTVTPEAVDRSASLQYCINSGSMTPCVSGSGITVNSLAVGTPKVLAIEVSASGGSVKKTYTVSITRQGSADATLSGLSVSAGTLSPGFSSATLSYTLSVPNANTSVNITPVTNTTTATLRYRIDSGSWNTGTSGSAVTVGSLAVNVTKTLYVEVTAQNGTTVKTYNVAVTRLAENNAYLSGISLSAGTLTPAFSAATTGYTVSVSGGVTSVTVTPTTASTLSTLRYRIDSGSWNSTTSGTGIAVSSLVTGVTKTLYVEVTAQDGITVKTYSVAVTRLAENNADLSGIALSAGTLTPAFSPATTAYTVSVSGGVTSVTVTPTTASTLLTLKYRIDSGSWNSTTSGTGIAVGSLVAGVAKTLYVEVTAQDGITVKTYSVSITRESGSALWARSVTTGSYSSEFNSVTTDSFGNIYAVGYQNSFGTYTYGAGVSAAGTSGSNNVVLVKYNSSGTAQWARTVVAGYHDNQFRSIAVDSSGNVYAAGFQYGSSTYTYGTGVSATGSSENWNNVVIVKYNSSGIAQWARSVVAGYYDNQFRSIAVDSSGNVYAAGFQYGSSTYTYGTGVSAMGTYSSGINPVLVKYNNSGTVQWARTVTHGESNSQINSIAVDSSGNVYVAGYEETGQILLVKYNSSGTALWARTFSNGSHAVFNSVAVDSSGDVYAAGYQNGSYEYTYGTGVSVTGTSSLTNVVLVKYNSSGTAQWARTVSTGDSDSQFYSVAADSSGNVYAAGFQDGNTLYTYGTGVSAVMYPSEWCVILVKYNSSGIAQWARTVSTGNTRSLFRSVAVDYSGNAYAAGYQYYAYTFTYGPGVSTTGTSSTENVVLVKYSE